MRTTRNYCQTVHPLSSVEDLDTHLGPSQKVQSSHALFRPHPCGPGVAATTFQWVHSLTYGNRLFFSRLLEGFPLSDTTSASCTQALIFHWISRFGIPLDTSSDRGPQFTSQLWTFISKLLGTQLRRTTAYHSESKRPMERVPSPPKICSSSPAHQSKLDAGITLGAPRHQYSA